MRFCFISLSLLYVILYSSLAASKKVNVKTAETRLLEDLFENYSSQSRPVNHSSQTVTVNVTMLTSQILTLDEKTEVLHSDIWLKMSWLDERMTWEPWEYEDMDTVFIGAEQIWTPDIFLFNMAGEIMNMGSMLDNRPREPATISNAGVVVNVLPLKASTSCKLDLMNFPFDSQNCSMTFGSWVYTDKLLTFNLYTQPGNLAPKGTWKVMNIYQETLRTPYKQGYDGSVQHYSQVVFHIEIKRNYLFYVINLIFPSFMMNVLMLVSLFVPVESGERMSVGLTVFTTYAVFTLMASDIMPFSMRSLPALCKFFFFTVIMNMILNTWTIFITRLQHRVATYGHPPAWLAAIFRTRKNGKIGSFTLDHGHGNDKATEPNPTNVKAGETDVDETSKLLEEWGDITRPIDKTLAVIYFIMIIIGVLMFIVIAKKK